MGIGELALSHAHPQTLDQLSAGDDADIGLDQRRFQFFKQILIQLGIALEQRTHAAGERPCRCRQPLAEPGRRRWPGLGRDRINGAAEGQCGIKELLLRLRLGLRLSLESRGGRRGAVYRSGSRFGD